mgnify:CR=1 FL=1
MKKYRIKTLEELNETLGKNWEHRVKSGYTKEYENCYGKEIVYPRDILQIEKLMETKISYVELESFNSIWFDLNMILDITESTFVKGVKEITNGLLIE